MRKGKDDGRWSERKVAREREEEEEDERRNERAREALSY